MREALLAASFLSCLHYSLDSEDMATRFKLTAVALARADAMQQHQRLKPPRRQQVFSILPLLFDTF